MAYEVVEQAFVDAADAASSVGSEALNAAGMIGGTIGDSWGALSALEAANAQLQALDLQDSSIQSLAQSLSGMSDQLMSAINYLSQAGQYAQGLASVLTTVDAAARLTSAVLAQLDPDNQ